MSATRRELLRLLDKLEGPIRAALLRDVRNITSRAQIAAMERAIAAGDLDALLRAAGIRPGSWAQLTEAIRQAYIEAGIFVIAADVPKRLGMTFDWTNPRAERWLREHSSRLITLINNEQRESIREVLEAGVRAGRNPRSIALDIVGRMNRTTGRREGGIIGLNGPQARAALNARSDLEDLNSNYFTRKARDRRFDSLVRRHIESGTPLSEADINRIVGRYEDRLLKLRGDTIGRTEALSSLNEASDESLRQVIDEGLAPPDAVKRIWRHSHAGNERPGHLEMEGTERGPDEPYTNPVTGAVLMHPGAGPASEVINCRCMLEHKIDFFAVENGGNIAGASAAPPQPPPPDRTFNGIGQGVRKRDWVSQWVKAGAFSTPRLRNLVAKIDDPGEITGYRGAFYNSDRSSISMGRHRPGQTHGRSVMRHEWGHYLDNQVGGLVLRDPNNFLVDGLRGALGSESLTINGYASGFKKAADALKADSSFLKKLGLAQFKKSNPSSRARVANQGRINMGWGNRRLELLRDDAASNRKMVADARLVLEESDSVVARSWRELRSKGFAFDDVDDIMFAEAVEAGDLSIMLSDRGKYLRAIFNEDSQSGVFESLSDLIGAITREDIGGFNFGPGHGRSYYKRNPVHYQGTEAFANMTALEMERARNPLLDELLRVLMPNYSGWYDDLIDYLNNSLGGV